MAEMTYARNWMQYHDYNEIKCDDRTYQALICLSSLLRDQVKTLFEMKNKERQG